MTPQTARTSILIALLIFLTASCTATVDSKSTATPTPAKSTTAPASPSSSPTASATGSDTIDRDLALDTQFANRFRTQYAVLAEGQSDEDLAAAGVKICVYLTDKFIEPALFTQRVQLAVSRDGIEPTAAQVHDIAQVATLTICPELQGNLTEIAATQSPSVG